MELLRQRIIRAMEGDIDSQECVTPCQYMLGYLDGHEDAQKEISIRVMSPADDMTGGDHGDT